MLPDFFLPEVANFVNICTTLSIWTPWEWFPQIFNELASTTLNSKGMIPAKESIQMILRRRHQRGNLCWWFIKHRTRNVQFVLKLNMMIGKQRISSSSQNQKFEKKTRGPGKKKKLKSDLAESGEKKKIYPENGEYRCNECEYVGKRKRYLDAHINKRHLDVWFNCEYKDCEKRYRSKHYLSGHITKDHKGRLFYCDKCYKSKFNDLLKLLTHHEAPRGSRFICDRCGPRPQPKIQAILLRLITKGCDLSRWQVRLCWQDTQ